MEVSDEELKSLEKELIKLLSEKTDIQNKITILSEKIKSIKRDAMLSYLPSMTPEKYMGIKYPESEYIHRELQNYIEKFPGVYRQGIHSVTNQAYLSVMFDQNKPFEEQLGILEFIPYMDHNEIGVFEYTLSEDGVFILEKGERPTLVKKVWGRKRELKEFDGLMEALRYIYDNHPWELRSNNDNDE